MRHVKNIGKPEDFRQPGRRYDVGRCAKAQEAAGKGEKPKPCGKKPTVLSIATQTYPMTMSHEVARTRCARRLNKELPVRANRLETVMLDNDRLTGKPRDQQRRQCRARDVNDLALANQAPQLKQIRPPDDPEREPAILFTAGLRNHSDVKFGRTICFAEICQPARQGQDDGFHAPDARREVMRVDQQLHRAFRRKPTQRIILASGSFTLRAKSLNEWFQRASSQKMSPPGRTKGYAAANSQVMCS